MQSEVDTWLSQSTAFNSYIYATATTENGRFRMTSHNGYLFHCYVFVLAAFMLSGGTTLTCYLGLPSSDIYQNKDFKKCSHNEVLLFHLQCIFLGLIPEWRETILWSIVRNSSFTSLNVTKRDLSHSFLAIVWSSL